MQSRVDPCRVNEVRISASGGWEQIGFYLNPWHWWLLQGLLSLFTVSIILVLAWCILNIHMNSFFFFLGGSSSFRSLLAK